MTRNATILAVLLLAEAAFCQLGPEVKGVWSEGEFALVDSRRGFAYRPGKEEWRKIPVLPDPPKNEGFDPPREDIALAALPGGKIVAATLSGAAGLVLVLHESGADRWKPIASIRKEKIAPGARENLAVRSFARTSQTLWLLVSPSPGEDIEIPDPGGACRIVIPRHPGGRSCINPAFHGSGDELFLFQNEYKCNSGTLRTPGGGGWTELEPPPLCAMGRSDFGHGLSTGHVLIAGGAPTWSSAIGAQYRDGGFLFGFESKRWEVLQAEEPLEAMHDPAVCPVPGGFVLFGGTWLPKTHALSLRGRTWRIRSSENAPTPRSKALSCWTGTEVLVWGGCGPRGAELHDGGAYDPDKDRWRALPAPPYAVGRDGDFRDPVYLPFSSMSAAALRKALETGRPFMVPDRESDSRGNPVVHRKGAGSDSALGLPHEIWFRSPRMEFVLVPPGTFLMGAEGMPPLVCDDEKPAHDVRITQPFYMAKYEVTKSAWNRGMEGSGTHPKAGAPGRGSDDEPAVRTGWCEARRFCLRFGFALPSEAQWEYACRGGAGRRDPAILTTGESVADAAWHAGNAKGSIHAVGLLEPNALGLYDMLGNAEEWCEDEYDPGFYATPEASRPDPVRVAYPRTGVRRGGAFWMTEKACRPTFRDHLPVAVDGAGFRPILQLRVP